MIKKFVENAHPETQRINRHAFVYAMEHSGEVQI